MNDDPLRAQLVRILDWEEAHIGFDKAVDGLPSDKRGALAPGVEHIRIAARDRQVQVEIPASRSCLLIVCP